MANLTHKKTITEKAVLKGYLNEDSTLIRCDDFDIPVQDWLDKFASGYVEITITTKTEEDLLEE